MSGLPVCQVAIRAFETASSGSIILVLSLQGVLGKDGEFKKKPVKVERELEAEKINRIVTATDMSRMEKM